MPPLINGGRSYRRFRVCRRRFTDSEGNPAYQWGVYTPQQDWIGHPSSSAARVAAHADETS